MSGAVTSSIPSPMLGAPGFGPSAFERAASSLDFGAPVTGAVRAGDAIAASFGDGVVRFFRDGRELVAARAHRGAVLCIAADDDHALTGGDDGRFLRIAPDGGVEEIASFGSRWVDCVAAARGARACSSGRLAHLWRAGEPSPKTFEHPSTVGGLAFDAKGRRLAVGHYGGATVWARGERRWKPSKLVWKGSHGAVDFSPDDKFVVTSTQENALHCWRLRDKKDMAMSGYPAKVKSFDWVGDKPYLATSGADQVICWPFDGKFGPMGRSALCLATGGGGLVTTVRAAPGEARVLLGFQDGAAFSAELDAFIDPVLLRRPTGVAVTAIAIATNSAHVLIGDDDGRVLFGPLPAGG